MIPSCEETAQLISESLDKKLPIAKRMGVWIHFLGCRFCRRFRRQMLLLRKAAKNYPDHIDDSQDECQRSLSPEAIERIKKSLKSSQEQHGASETEERS